MRKYIIAIIIVIVIVISICICAYAEDITGLQEQSNELTQQINDTNNRLQVVQEEISTYMQQLQELDSKLVESQEELNVINIEVDSLIQQISENEQKLEKTQKEYNDIQGLLDARLIQMYETPQLHFLQVILEAKSVTEFLSTYYAMIELAEYDQELLQKVRRQMQDIETTKKILDEKKNQIVTKKH